MANYNYIIGTRAEIQDGNLPAALASVDDRLLLLGTASQGPSNIGIVTNESNFNTIYGTKGTLRAAFKETMLSSPAKAKLCYRIGQKAARLEGLGVDAAVGGVIVELAQEGNTDHAGLFYIGWYNPTRTLAVMKLNSASDDTGTLVLYWAMDDNKYPEVDTGEVYVYGSFIDGEGATYTKLGATLADKDSVLVTQLYQFTTIDSGGYAGELTYVDPVDGTDGLSNMELFEGLYVASTEALTANPDWVFPGVDVFLDAPSIADIGSGGAILPDWDEVYTLPLAGAYDIPGAPLSTSPYPAQDGDDDILLYVHHQEYEGRNYFWWSTKAVPTLAADIRIYPNGHQATDMSGTTLLGVTFYEAQHAYQLAIFCHNVTKNFNACHGVIGVRAPAGVGQTYRNVNQYSLKEWVGELPTVTKDSNGNYVIASANANGTGLCGNKFMAGKYGYRSNSAGGGFILTDTEFPGGTEQVDNNGHYVDLGKYLTVVASWGLTSGSIDPVLGQPLSSKKISLASVYAGQLSTIAVNASLTNNVLRGKTMSYYTLLPQQLDNLAACHYVCMADTAALLGSSKQTGMRIMQADIAARYDSDFKTYFSFAVVKAVIDMVREQAVPYIGKNAGQGSSTLKRLSFQNTINEQLSKMKENGMLDGYQASVRQNVIDLVNGVYNVDIALNVSQEIRRINLSVSLKVV